MLLNKKIFSITELSLIIYDLYEIDIDDEKLLKELSSNTPRAVKKLLKESIVFVTSDDLLT